MVTNTGGCGHSDVEDGDAEVHPIYLTLVEFPGDHR